MLIKKILTFFFLTCFSFNLFAAEERLEVMVKKEGLPPDANVDELLTLNGMRQAITNELMKGALDSEVFWKKLETRNLSDTQEVEFLRPRFNKVTLAVPEAAIIPAPAPGQPVASPPPVAPDAFNRGVLLYELDPLKVKVLFNEVAADLPDTSIKTFYIVPEIAIAKDMTWNDVGVGREENFSGVIVDSWKKWAGQFKDFTNVVVLQKDFASKPENMHPESLTLKWTSLLKKPESFPDRKSARYELSAQYVLVNSKTSQSLVAFDFPTQKREFGTANPKELSSNLASLVYNLLNSQTAKINSNIELNKNTTMLKSVDIRIVGKHGIFDITQINSFLTGAYKDFMLTSELKSYSSEASVISIKSTQSPEELYAILAKDGGKLPLNEQKILLFSSENKTFAIIPKEANN